MDGELIALNLACVEKHFHSEAADEVEAALDLYTDDIVWDAPALNGLNRQFSGKQAVAKNYRVGPMCCTPERAGLTVVFSEFRVTEPTQKDLHDLT